ncbi:CAP domain-containing protein [Paenibacillus sp. NEAU-GSW1]|uniref:CAP domain-containing protein n=1 Tax=Paenibacillus sp. NEAU-GSW1 TaxID=2682486 RepID=UPI0012E27E69|nr:CAP domain-containing protein [Paenibacillus sp. NEAU-GSW1]MUT67579.1 SCP-like extracellular [Paenibacillus sp. NEAU-GSW1]
MKMQTLRVGVASLAAAALISAGVTAPTAGAAEAVKTNSNVIAINKDQIAQIAKQYGIDLDKITFGGITIQLPVIVTKPSTGTGTTTKPSTGTGTTTKPSTGTGTTTKPSTGTGTTTKPSTGTGTTTKPSTGTGTTTKPSTGTGTTTKPSTGTGNNSNTNSGTVSQSEFQKQVVTLVNQERAKAGLAALATDALLTKVATAKAKDMDDNNYFSHTSPTYGSPFDMMKQFGVTYSYAGENIASGQKTPQEVMNAWMNSSGHRANILSANFKKIGVGYVNGKWVQEFTG